MQLYMFYINTNNIAALDMGVCEGGVIRINYKHFGATLIVWVWLSQSRQAIVKITFFFFFLNAHIKAAFTGWNTRRYGLDPLVPIYWRVVKTVVRRAL